MPPYPPILVPLGLGLAAKGCPSLNRTVHYCLTNNKHFSFPATSLPEQLHGQKEIVELMANYMEQNLMEVRPAARTSTKPRWATALTLYPPPSRVVISFVGSRPRVHPPCCSSG